jgi:hypothetical protein
LRSIVKKLVFELLGSGIRIPIRVQKIANAKHLTILNLHRVSEDDGSAYKPLHPDQFEALLLFLKKNYRFVTVNDLGGGCDLEFSDLPLIMLSFDDGYLDFYNYAHPILSKYQIRVNQNIIPNAVDTGRPPLNVMVQDFIGKCTQNQLNRFSIPGFELNCNKNDRLKYGALLSNFIKNRPMTEQIRLWEHIQSFDQGVVSELSTPMMSLRHIREISTCHNLGAHSISHATMGFETDDYFLSDLSSCKNWFNSNLQMDVRIYAFPNGSYRQGQIDLALTNGYDKVMLVNEKFSKVKEDSWNRFTFHGQSSSEVRFRATGGLSSI